MLQTMVPVQPKRTLAPINLFYWAAGGVWNAMKAADQLHPLYRWFALVLSGIAMLLVVVATVLLYLWFAIGLWCWLAFEIYVRLKR